MEEKKLIVIAVVVVAIVAILGFAFSSGMFNNSGPTTAFDNEFMSGIFTGNVKLVNNTTDYSQSWQDEEHHISYNMTTVDNSSALVDIQDVQSILANGGVSGLKGPEKRDFNGQEWNIYFTQGISQVNGSENKTMNIIICEHQGEKQGYLIYIIFDNSSDVNFTLNTFCDAYELYTKPLLESISLKDNPDIAISVADSFGMSESEFEQQMYLVHQIKIGNYSALEGVS